MLRVSSRLVPVDTGHSFRSNDDGTDAVREVMGHLTVGSNVRSGVSLRHVWMCRLILLRACCVTTGIGSDSGGGSAIDRVHDRRRLLRIKDLSRAL